MDPPVLPTTTNLKRKKNSYLRRNSFNVKIREMQMHFLSLAAVEEVRALRIPGIWSWRVGRSERAVVRLTTIIHERTRKLFELPPCVYTKICKEKRFYLRLHNTFYQVFICCMTG